MKKTVETFEVVSVMQDARGYRVQFAPEGRAPSTLALGLRSTDDPQLKPGQKLRVTIEVVAE